RGRCGGGAGRPRRRPRRRRARRPQHRRRLRPGIAARGGAGDRRGDPVLAGRQRIVLQHRSADRGERDRPRHPATAPAAGHGVNRQPQHAPPRAPASRDLRLVLPTLALFAATAATVGMRPGPAAALAVVLLSAAVVAAAWGVAAGSGPRVDRAALGVLAVACAVGAVGAGTQAARTHTLDAHPLVEKVGGRTGIDAVVTGFDRPMRGGGVMLPVRVEVTGTGPSARRAELDVVVLARDGWRGGAGGGRRGGRARRGGLARTGPGNAGAGGGRGARPALTRGPAGAAGAEPTEGDRRAGANRAGPRGGPGAVPAGVPARSRRGD